MRLLICAGGTGGGVYPALSVLQAVGDRAESVLWVGGKGGMEAELVAQYQIPFTDIPAAGVHGVGIRALPGNIAKLLQGTARSRQILREFKPDVLLFTGGYVAVPMALAGNKVKSLLYVPDIEPGLALKALARFTDVIALTADESMAFFNSRKHLVVTGYPIRTNLKVIKKELARKTFNLSNNLPVLLVFGGSKGARSINNALLANLPTLLKKVQIVHITGKLDWNEIQESTKNLPAAVSQHYHPYPFLYEEMGAAFSCADLCVCRAGASTLGELPLFALPAILVPYPYAWRYQKVNADFLVKKGAAQMIRNDELSDRLYSAVSGLLDNRPLLSEMCEKMRLLVQPNAAKIIADLLVELAGMNSAGRNG